MGKNQISKSFANLVFIVIIGHSWYHVRTIPLNFHVDIFIRSVSGMGGQEGDTWRMLRILDWRLWRYGNTWCQRWSYFTQRKILWEFHVNIFIWTMSWMGVKRWYLEDVEGSSMELWINKVIHEVMNHLLETKYHTWKFLCNCEGLASPNLWGIRSSAKITPLSTLDSTRLSRQLSIYTEAKTTRDP